MREIDQGIGAVGLLGLACALVVLLTTGLPLVLSPDALKLSDLYGFAGSILGSLVTLLAAFLAWRAVQKQIALQREQMLIGVLMREDERLGEVELPALEAFTHVVLELRQNVRMGTPEQYARAFERQGLPYQGPELEKALAEKIGTPVPGQWLRRLVHQIQLTSDCVLGIAVWEQISATRNRGLGPLVDDAEARMKKLRWVQKEYEEFADEYAKKLHSARMLRRQFRSRIEAALTNMS
jgi:hypothetical protein